MVLKMRIRPCKQPSTPLLQPKLNQVRRQHQIHLPVTLTQAQMPTPVLPMLVTQMPILQEVTRQQIIIMTQERKRMVKVMEPLAEAVLTDHLLLEKSLGRARIVESTNRK